MQYRRRRKLKKGNRVLQFFVLVLPLLAWAFGASSEPAKAASTPASAEKAQNQVVVSAPTKTEVTKMDVKSAAAYTYTVAGRRDPFAPIIERDIKKAKSTDLPPLERFNINEFKLSGIVWGGFGYNAMVEGPDGKGYFVRVGSIMGPNRGVVKKITQTNLIIQEKFKTSTGETQLKEFIVEIRKK